MSQLRLYLLGPPRIECEGQPIKADTRKATALLAYLAITKQSYQRESLVYLLWPDYDQGRGFTNLRRTLYALHKVLVGDWLEIDRDCIGLNPKADFWLDVEQFHQHLNARLSHSHLAAQFCPTCLESLTAAVGVYHGDFMSGFSLKDSFSFDEWQFLQAENLRREYAGALEKLVEGLSAQGDFELALNYGRRWLALDSLNEVAHCQLMQLYSWTGQRSAVIQQYKEVTQILKRELGISPQASTTSLYQAIVKDKGPRPPASTMALSPTIRRSELTEIKLSSVQADQGFEPKPKAMRVFVAREFELNMLLTHLEEAALKGHGKPVFVVGSAGQGKTYLIQEFARVAQARSPNLIFAGGNCNAQIGLGDPYLPFREILNLLTGDVDARWAAQTISRENARRLWEIFPNVIETLVEMSPDLIDTFVSGLALERRAAAYVTGEIHEEVAWLTRLKKLVAINENAHHDHNLQQAALFEQYTNVLANLTRERPILLVLDDLQWADMGSISLLFHLGHRLTGCRILIVGAYRPEELALRRESERHPLEKVVNEFRCLYGEIMINLALAENRTFMDKYLDSEPNRLGAKFRKTLYQKTSGHPLFTVELLRGMTERGDLVQDDKGYWIEGKDLNWEILPSRIEAVIAERVGRLDLESQEALRIASVEGEVFTAEVLARVLNTEARHIVWLLSERLERDHRLVHAQEIQRLGTRHISRYRFRHFMFQNYLYQSLDPIQRAYLHEDVGLALEDLYVEDPQNIAISLARHFIEAGIDQKAIKYLFLAGEKARRGSAHEAAIGHLTRGLVLLRKLPRTPERDRQELEFLIALGVPLLLTRGHAVPEVEDVYTRASELCLLVGDKQQHFQALLGLRRYYLHRGESRKAYELSEQLLAVAHKLGDETYISRAYMMYVESLYRLGEFDKIPEYSKQGLSYYDPRQSITHVYLFGNDTGIGCRIFNALAEWHLGYPSQALRSIQQSLDHAQEISHAFTLVFALFFAARISQLCLDVLAVQDCVEALLRISRERGFALYQAWGTILHGWVLTMEDEMDEGIATMRHGLSAWQGMGAKLLVPNFLLLIAEAQGRADRIDEGISLLDVAQSIMEQTGEKTFEAELHRLRGDLFLMTGNEEKKAEESYNQAINIARDQKAHSWELRAVTSLSQLWQRQGKVTQAIELLTGVYSWFTEGFDTPDLKKARAVLEGLKSSSLFG